MNLRPMLMSDADKMLEWKNYPETRQFAIASHNEIKKEDHYKWLENNLQYFQVIIAFDQTIGAIRIQDKEVSIWVDREFRRASVATKILTLVSTNGMWAKIVNGNVASFRAFVKAGYIPVHYDENFYILRK